MLEERDRDPSIPPDLAEALGRDAVQRMWECLSQDGEPPWAGGQWWTAGLPLFVRQLIIEADCHRERREQVEVRLGEWHVECAELREENEELRCALLVAEGEKKALHDVIQRCRWGE